MSRFKVNEIVVATKTEKLGCGRIVVYDGAILMVANPEMNRWREIGVYKSKERYECDQITWVNPNILRKANDNENRAFYLGVKNIINLN